MSVHATAHRAAVLGAVPIGNTSLRHQSSAATLLLENHTISGSNPQPGDLLGSDTISGSTPARPVR